MTYQETTAIKGLCSFLTHNYEPLRNAAFLLGGGPALRRIQSLCDDLRSNQTLTRSSKRNLVELHKVLSLYYVADPERLEHGLFARIDPYDPVVEEICLLTDGLMDHMRAIDNASNAPVFHFDMAA
ncbi:hypothetical protein [Falsihalocynthiibacter arcticus]|uniref:Uncharacterized protein n=1 Tax=Falsihalocynthiibacter arcticus TaxID=1579316 RepID=A0A126V3W1_9RHOB|nr:hypothetical protein [Falsihalocynthiibacter arcticus]AML53021.1 hypothetical protein RC74_18725 [Falsihalocynthiibacter arcticus]